MWELVMKVGVRKGLCNGGFGNFRLFGWKGFSQGHSRPTTTGECWEGLFCLELLLCEQNFCKKVILFL